MNLIKKISKIQPIYPLKQQLNKGQRHEQFGTFHQTNQNSDFDTFNTQLKKPKNFN
ncbi:MAG: hypothetical protein HFI09_05385 [Bacilli bacterium]|nr:hypothetical protein [Bacilli bacterium]